MSVRNKIVVIGGDKRMYYTAEFLKDNGYCVTIFGHNVNTAVSLDDKEMLKDAIANSQVIVGPIPFTRDGIDLFSENNPIIPLRDFPSLLRAGQVLFGGNIPSFLKEELHSMGILIHDFMESDDIALKNAVATAEGSIAEAISLSERNLHKSRCLVLGYGRCGKALAFRLKGMGAYVTVAARRQEQLLQAALQGHEMLSLDCLLQEIHRFDFIFNTIPALILHKEMVSCVQKDSIIIDIASKPGGTDFSACKDYNITASLSLGLPGKYAPKTSAGILAEEIEKVLCHSVSYGAAKAAECEGL